MSTSFLPCGIDAEPRLKWLTEWFYVGDGEHQDDPTELSYQPSARTASPSERFIVEYEILAFQR